MSPAVWVTRDTTAYQWYRIHETKPDVRERDAGNMPGMGYAICPDKFQRITGFRLKHGEGPVKVRIEVKRHQLPHLRGQTMTKLERIRRAVADYMSSEGCSCCQSIHEHREHAKILAELLSVPIYSDGSGYDFSQFITKAKP